MLLHPKSVTRYLANSVAFSLIALATPLTFPGIATAGDAPSTSIANEVVSRLHLDDLSSGGYLLFVGPGTVTSNDSETTVTVLGQTAVIEYDTEFPRGLVTPGDYIAVTGKFGSDGKAEAASVIRLGGSYSVGNSPVYLHGTIKSLTTSGIAQIGDAEIDLAQAYGGSKMSALVPSDAVEILGFEAHNSRQSALIIATSASNSTGSGVRGITGSGVRGITGSGVRGITGSGVRGITGSGVRGITGSGVRGITGSGVRGITGSGVRGITGSGVRGITGSGVRGITGSGVRGITGSGVRGITGSGVRGITGSGVRGITGSGVRGLATESER